MNMWHNIMQQNETDFIYQIWNTFTFILNDIEFLCSNRLPESLLTLYYKDEIAIIFLSKKIRLTLFTKYSIHLPSYKT